MGTTTEQLQRLRVWFVVYTPFNFILGTWASVTVVDALRSSSLPFMYGLQDLTNLAVIAWSFFVGALFCVRPLPL